MSFLQADKHPAGAPKDRFNWTRIAGILVAFIGVVLISAEVAIHVAHSFGMHELDADSGHRMDWINMALGAGVFTLGMAWATNKGDGIIDVFIEGLRKRWGGNGKGGDDA